MTNYPQKAATIFDLEFTAWEGSLKRRWLGPGEYTELVQIGAMKLDPLTFEPLGEFEILVKPRLNAALSDYLVGLTGITNAEMDARGVDFLEGFRRFVDFVDGGRMIAFGRDDLIFEGNLRLYGIKNAPPIPPYTNIIPWMVKQGFDLKGKHACDTGPLAGVPFVGHRHNALHDARSVAAGIKALVAGGAPNILLGE
jgi:inhibitor of KinA sporulation pathway (predicted exonuclease)